MEREKEGDGCEYRVMEVQKGVNVDERGLKRRERERVL